jgi:hypothetical protein
MKERCYLTEKKEGSASCSKKRFTPHPCRLVDVRSASLVNLISTGDKTGLSLQSKVTCIGSIKSKEQVKCRTTVVFWSYTALSYNIASFNMNEAMKSSINP